jgi:intein/homing endonuclease
MCDSYDDDNLVEVVVTEEEVMDPVLEKILLAVDNRENIILHSPGGTGKTFILCKIATYISDKGKVIYCTATTGIAAINLNVPEKKISGSTLHSWAGVGLALESAKKLFTKVYHNDKARKRWLNTDVLVIDEVSMLGAEFLDKLDFIGKSIRNKPKLPFGGIQVILSGDFLQLAPINEEWSFKSMVWDKLELVPFIFDEPKRYDDIDYFHLLIRVREGKQTPEDIGKLKARTRAYDKLLKALREAKGANVIKPTILFSKKIDVESYNDKELNKLPGESIEYIADDIFTAYTKKGKKDYYFLKLDDAIPKSITLKTGAQIMLRCNLDVKRGLVNGSRGVVLELDPEYIYVRFINGIKIRITKHAWELEDKEGKAIRSQIPFILSWSITIHKCVNENTLISTDFGLVKIGTLSTEKGWTEKKINLDTLKGIESTSNIFKGEVETSIIVTTSMGYTLEGSNRHPVLVRTQLGNDEWRLLPEIQKGDNIILRSGSQGAKINVYISQLGEITINLSYILGILTGYKFQWNDETGIVNFDFSKIIEKVLQDKFCIHKNRPNFCCRKTMKMLVDLGVINSFAEDKIVPWYILQSPQNIQLSFLRGLFGVDGLNKKQISINFLSELMSKEVHILLLSLEIISKRFYVVEDKLWRIEITGEYLNIYIRKIESITNYDEKEKLLVNDCLFTDVISSISLGNCQMYDVEVPGSHSFISNGIVSHNSQGCTLDYAICDLGPNVFACGQAYVALSRVRNLRGLFISEFYPKSIKVNKTALRYSKELQKIQKQYVPRKRLYDLDEEEFIEEDDDDFDDDFDFSNLIVE